MKIYKVVKGDSLSKIAKRFETTASKIYGHPGNEEFRTLRPNPNHIEVGDEIWIPGNGRPPEAVLLVSEEGDPGEDRTHPWLDHDNEHLTRYKVEDGDSLASIAEGLGCPWQEIAMLNWGTEDPEEINWYLENYFVCTKKSGGNWVFSYDDSPGILLLPRSFEASNRTPIQTVRASRFVD